jgi:hypothetical protein
MEIFFRRERKHLQWGGLLRDSVENPTCVSQSVSALLGAWNLGRSGSPDRGPRVHGSALQPGAAVCYLSGSTTYRDEKSDA